MILDSICIYLTNITASLSFLLIHHYQHSIKPPLTFKQQQLKHNNYQHNQHQYFLATHHHYHQPLLSVPLHTHHHQPLSSDPPGEIFTEVLNKSHIGSINVQQIIIAGPQGLQLVFCVLGFFLMEMVVMMMILKKK